MPSGPYDALEKEAERLENQSKDEFGKKNFVMAISFLEEAKEIYSKLGFQGKIGMINQRIARLKNLVKFEKQDTMVQTKSEQEFQERVQKVMNEKQMYQEKQAEVQMALSPEMIQKLEKIKLLKEKAEKEEKLNKFSRVLGRYEYILELYKSIPKEIMDTRKEIYEIEKKISLIKPKL
ncbi:MAG: hypothetical protein ACFFDY_10670 [Candidatus Thorarchaeota archaeon]